MTDDFQIPQTARETIVATRKLFGRSAEEVATAAGIDLEIYLKWEAGEMHFYSAELLELIERAADPRGGMASLDSLRSTEDELAWLRKKYTKALKRMDQLEKRILKLSKPDSKRVN